MCLACKKIDNKIWNTQQNRRTKKPISFTPKQRDQLKKNFQKISLGKNIITKELFRQNLGLLGLRLAVQLADRLFNSFDLDDNGQINFADFVEYMQIIKNGDKTDKAYISFRMIKINKKRKYFDKKDFQQFMKNFLQTWSTMTHHQISAQIIGRKNEYINQIFQKVKQKQKTNEQKIDFDYYKDNLYNDPHFMSAFDFITQGVTDFFVNKPTQKQERLEKKFIQLQQSLENIYKQLYKGNICQFGDIGQQSKPNLVPVFRKFQFPFRFQNDQKSRNQFQYNELNSLKSTQINFKKQVNPYQIKLNAVKNQFGNILRDLKIIRKQIQTQNLKDQILNDNNRQINTVANVHKKQKQKQGKMIFIGDNNWNLVLNMMIGIQMAVKTVNSYQNQQMIYQQPKDFDLKYYFQLIPRRFGGDKTHNLSTICKFTDYAPNTFNHIRRFFGIDNQSYIKSIGTEKVLKCLIMGEVSTLSQLTSQGKSGSFFYYTADGQYMLKTIHHREYNFLKSILKQYYQHLTKNKDSLITKFFGLHKIVQRTQTGDTLKKHYFVIMANVFNTPEKIIERFDLKGSTYGRQSADKDQKATKKDNDFRARNCPIYIDQQERENLLNIIQKDAQFFERYNVIDYSLLVGIIRKKTKGNQNSYISEQSINNNNNNLNAKIYESIVQKQQQQYKQKYVFGIIDILTLYDTRKKMQYCFKNLFYGKGISAIPPDQYSQRFFAFISQQVFK